MKGLHITQTVIGEDDAAARTERSSESQLSGPGNPAVRSSA
jgi:hypothetical protein